MIAQHEQNRPQLNLKHAWIDLRASPKFHPDVETKATLHAALQLVDGVEKTAKGQKTSNPLWVEIADRLKRHPLFEISVVNPDKRRISMSSVSHRMPDGEGRSALVSSTTGLLLDASQLNNQSWPEVLGRVRAALKFAEAYRKLTVTLSARANAVWESYDELGKLYLQVGQQIEAMGIDMTGDLPKLVGEHAGELRDIVWPMMNGRTFESASDALEGDWLLSHYTLVEKRVMALSGEALDVASTEQPASTSQPAGISKRAAKRARQAAAVVGVPVDESTVLAEEAAALLASEAENKTAIAEAGNVVAEIVLGESVDLGTPEDHVEAALPTDTSAAAEASTDA